VCQITAVTLLTPSHRHILRPAWVYGHQCCNLEAAMTFAAFVLETLNIVNDQVERRTYGKHTLRITIQAWEGLLRQTRLLLLLRSRAGSAAVSTPHSAHSSETTDPVRARRVTEFTAYNLSSGQISLHRMLAQDTLGFAVRAEQALEHEEKCRDVYAKSVQARRMQSQASSVGGGSTTGGSQESHHAAHKPQAAAAQGKSEVLLAWGPVADKRWRDLLAVAVAEDSIQAALQSEVSTASAGAAKDSSLQSMGMPSPLASAITSVLSLTSSTVTATPTASSSGTAAEQARRAEEQKRTLKRRRPLLLYFPLHGQSHVLGSYRTIILAER
jgi:hypothetical protein